MHYIASPAKSYDDLCDKQQQVNDATGSLSLIC